MSLIAPQDAAFLLGETAAQPTHVAGLAVYELPPGTDPDYVSLLYHELPTPRSTRGCDGGPPTRSEELATSGGPRSTTSTWSTTSGWRRCRGPGGCASCWSWCLGCTARRSTATTRFGSSI